MTSDQRMVDVELLQEAARIVGCYADFWRLAAKLRASAAGPGVEPIPFDKLGGMIVRGERVYAAPSAPVAPVQAVTDEVTKRPDALARDSARWDAIETLMVIGDVELTQEEDGGYGIFVDPVENFMAQKWVGNDPGQVADAVVAALAAAPQPPKDGERQQ